jgi:hypothetical protein
MRDDTNTPLLSDEPLLSIAALRRTLNVSEAPIRRMRAEGLPFVSDRPRTDSVSVRFRRSDVEAHFQDQGDVPANH